MKVLVVDPSGKVPRYDDSLCSALYQEGLDIMLVSPFNHKEFNSSKYYFKKLFKISNKFHPVILKTYKPIEGVLNYFYIIGIIMRNKFDVIHFQWLPFLEYISIEKWFLWMCKIVSPSTKFVLTQHNLYPHNSSSSAKKIYKKRMQFVKKKFDHFILHTESSKNLFCKEYGIDDNKVSTIYHGVLSPSQMPIRRSSTSRKRILMYGIQSHYKGTDILVDAISLLPTHIREQLQVTIAGGTDPVLLTEKINIAKQNDISWIPRYIEDDELNQMIVDSDVLVLPYRAISQSGVLLQSLPYKKHLLLSDLPSFRETLYGYPEECFFKAGSAEDLASSIISYVKGDVDMNTEMIANQKLLDKYSWTMSANKTIELYTQLTQ